MVTTGITRRFLCLVVFMFVLVPTRVGADSYDVTASIPYPVPAVAAVIDPSFEGKAVGADVLEVFGTCQYVLPVSIVSIWRGDSLLGSVNCETNGTFRLNVTLVAGGNQLVARTSNVSNNYGPQSAAVSVVYTPPPSTSRTPPQPAASNLEVSSPMPFFVLDASSSVTIQITVDGGQSPYTLVINWGDGSTETLQLDEPGDYTFSHVYTNQGIYKVVATVTDTLGVSKIYQFIVTSATPATQQNEPNVSEGQLIDEDSGASKTMFQWSLLPWTLFMLVSTFFLGRRYQSRKMQNKIRELEEKINAQKTRGS